MLVDNEGRFISQREWPRLCLFRVSTANEGFEIKGQRGESVRVPLSLAQGRNVMVSVWSDNVCAIEADQEVNQFFSRELDMPCRLVYMPEESHRFADSTYAGDRQLTSFSDAYPLLLIGSGSLRELNRRLRENSESEMSWDRFRPNIVVATDEPHVEDSWSVFTLGNVEARGVKLCSRCVVTTIDQSSAVTGKEPIRTLAKYRTMKNKIMFGQNVIAHHGVIRIGDSIRISKIAFPPNAEF